ncbi:MAG: hypothetical protein RI885_2024 [Actinomycetota bacterium]
MVSFDNADRGTAEAEWMLSDRWARIPTLDVSRDLAGIDRLVVVSAHPDDESLGVAGLIARAAASGWRLDVVVATDGEASHPLSPTVAPDDLALRRRDEVVIAVAALAPTAGVSFLGLPDADLRAHADDLRDHLSALGTGPDTLVVAPWRGDGHGDHRVAGTIAAAVAAVSGAVMLEYPVWMWHWAEPDSPEVPWARLSRFELTEAESRAKRAAIAAHESQHTPLSEAPGDEAVLSADFLTHFARSFETFVAPPQSESLGAHFFDTFYQGSDDPWGFETRWYESRKRDLTVASLPRRYFRSALEIGCSIGVLTERLTARCERLVAVDIAEKPLQRATERLRDEPSVRFELTDATHSLPTGPFDLIVLSEVGYYWSDDDLDGVLARIDAALTPDGVVVACHWRHPVSTYPGSGDAVHAALRARPGFAVLASHLEEDFVLEVFVRPPARSVATRAGLV